MNLTMGRHSALSYYLNLMFNTFAFKNAFVISTYKFATDIMCINDLVGGCKQSKTKNEEGIKQRTMPMTEIEGERERKIERQRR